MIRLCLSEKRYLWLIGRFWWGRYLAVCDMTTAKEGFNDCLASFITANGTSKQTAPDRFADVDGLSARLIRERGLRSVHDLGVSSGVGSLGLINALADQKVAFFLSDKYAQATVGGSLVKRFHDADGTLIGGCVFGVFFSRHLSWFFLLSKLLASIVSFFCRKPGATTLLLIDPEVKSLLETKKACWLDRDIFAPPNPDDRFDFIRCMNLLNHAYFNPDQIVLAVNNLLSTLNEGGVLQIGRTHSDGSNHVSFFAKQQGRLMHLQDFNSGSEIKPVVLVCSHAL